jgi:hypothetical protein
MSDSPTDAVVGSSCSASLFGKNFRQRQQLTKTDNPTAHRERLAGLGVQNRNGLTLEMDLKGEANEKEEEEKNPK